MRRTQAIFVIVALLASPIALLARGMAGDSGECDHLCCLRHSSHITAKRSLSEGMICHRGAASHKCDCAMESGQKSMDYGLLAPIVPTAPSAILSIQNPEVSREHFAQILEQVSSGFLSLPFEPPRA
jgi:hypothetical protein